VVMAKWKIVSDYIILDYFWMIIEPLLPVPRPKKKSGIPERMIG